MSAAISDCGDKPLTFGCCITTPRTSLALAAFAANQLAIASESVENA